MERVAADIEGIHLGIADLDALLVGALVENAFDFQSRLGRGCRNQFDDGGAALQWPAAPVLRDVAEQTVLDLVPLGRAWRIVADLDWHLHYPDMRELTITADCGGSNNVRARL